MENMLSSADVLRIAKEKCLAPAFTHGTCRYFLPTNGHKCAVGCVLPDALARSLEGVQAKASSVFDKIAHVFDQNDVTPEFLDRLQHAHDQATFDAYDGATEDDRKEIETIGSEKNLAWRREFLHKLECVEVGLD